MISLPAQLEGVRRGYLRSSYEVKPSRTQPGTAERKGWRDREILARNFAAKYFTMQSQAASNITDAFARESQRFWP
jgi:hypothetical protein